MPQLSSDEIVRRQRERTRRDIAAASKVAADRVLKVINKAEKKNVTPDAIAEIIRAAVAEKLGV
jgi:hypothetical protein